MTKKQLADELNVKQEVVNKLCKSLGIKHDNINEEEKLDIKKKYLDLFKEELVKQHKSLKKEKEEFQQYKKGQENSLKEKLEQEELNHKMKLEEQKIKTITQLKTEFLENIKSEYDKVNTKLDDLTQKELKLIEWQKNVEQSEKTFIQEKELFESEKEKLLNLYKQKLEKDKEIFINQQEEQKVKKIKETSKKIEELYESKAKEIEDKEEELRGKDVQLKTQIAEIKAKEKSLESKNESLSKQVKENIAEEIKIYQEKIKSFERANKSLHEDLSELRDELNNYEKFDGRDLDKELKEKQEELIRVKKMLDEITQEKNTLSIQLDNQSAEYRKEKQSFENEKNKLLKDNLEVESLKSNKSILDDKISSKDNRIEFLQGEKRKLEENLHSIFSQGKETELRVEDIKREPFLKRELKDELLVQTELKWLDEMEENMKKYGVIYPQRLLYSFHTALKSAERSPLSVLSGVSGTGKSELPKLYSHFGGFNFLAEAVQSTWDSPESMLGYYNTIESKFDATNILRFLIQTSQSKSESPFGWQESMNMILLDEMNLSHIELYFSEFLSKFEQRRGSDGINIDIKLGTGMNYPLPLKENVLWIGTMNEDETTKSLSDKVLDRSFSINFPRPDKLFSKPRDRKKTDIKPFEYLSKNTWNKWVQKESLFIDEKKEVLEKYREVADRINKVLTPTGRAIGHRVWQSMEYYINNHPLVIQNIGDDDLLTKNVKLAFEEQLVQKIMPKLRGIETHGKEEKKVLENIRAILNQEDFKITEDFELSMKNPYGQFIWNSANYLKED